MKIDKWVLAGEVIRGMHSYVHIQFDGKRLSISGVEGPIDNCNCRGSCGQIDISKNSQWGDMTREEIAELARVWEAWHLNDMRAGCEHQRKNWDTKETIEVVTYKLTSDALTAISGIKHAAFGKLVKGETVTLAPLEAELLELPYLTTQAPDANSAASGRYEVHQRENKSVGWVKPSEHPKGLLCKPCEVCGYKYGSAWLHEDVPQDVISFLKSLPSCDRPKGW